MHTTPCERKRHSSRRGRLAGRAPPVGAFGHPFPAAPACRLGVAQHAVVAVARGRRRRGPVRRADTRPPTRHDGPMDLPVMPPVAPMLAKSVKEIPDVGACSAGS